MDRSSKASAAEKDKHIHGDATVGKEIREVRNARGLTISQLGEATGRSVANISRIERGETAINADSLNDIGAALNVDPRWFFPSRSGKGELERRYIVRSEARRPMSALYTRQIDELGYKDELLSSTLSGQFYITSSVYPARTSGTLTPQEGFTFEGEQHGIVIKGELDLYLGSEVIRLTKDDSFSFPSMIPHYFCNPGREDAVMIWAASPVQISW